MFLQGLLLSQTLLSVLGRWRKELATVAAMVVGGVLAVQALEDIRGLEALGQITVQVALVQAAAVVAAVLFLMGAVP
jgi:hypothetical protein